ncbi:MAG: hypothetical protein D6798_04915 [Deltaproteobacteria bacterium]|nr:MAG: hypothetical protein D6798_04915 [Deltaproteobacteria bacterium]
MYRAGSTPRRAAACSTRSDSRWSRASTAARESSGIGVDDATIGRLGPSKDGRSTGAGGCIQRITSSTTWSTSKVPAAAVINRWSWRGRIDRR